MIDSLNMQHFILTRFNLLLWNRDKEGNKVRSKQWLVHRFSLFEKYCLPSINKQTYKNFEWIVLFDSTTPEAFKKRVEKYQKECPQLTPIYVEPKDGQRFAQIFREKVIFILNNQEFENMRMWPRVLTTYLDNDDALSINFVEDVQRRAAKLANGTFVNYIDGYQYYTDHNYMMQIHYPRNHFMSVVEDGNADTLKTIYGYGSHYYIEKIPGVKIVAVKNQPMWCEVIHEKNMGNDAYFLGAKRVNDAKDFGFMFQDSCIKNGIGIYLFRYLPRYAKTLVRRIGYRLFGRHW